MDPGTFALNLLFVAYVSPVSFAFFFFFSLRPKWKWLN